MMKYSQLGDTDIYTSALGLGGSAFGDVFGGISRQEQKLIIDTAIEAGVNYIDTAPYYGLTKAEMVLGEVRT